MNKNCIILVLSILLLSMTTGCGNKTKPTESDKKDTVPTAIRFLPDTAYASASAIVYHIDSADSLDHTLGAPDNFYDGDDVLTFRKTPRRDATFGGRVKGTPSSIEVTWTFRTAEDYKRSWHDTQWGGGSGWTGQPLYLKKTNEIVVGSLSSYIYFLNFETGDTTRAPLYTHNPIKGTMSYDPVYNNLYVGQGVPCEQPFGCMVFDLDKHQETQLRGIDPKARRNWGAYDSSPVIVGGYLFWPGENGSIYKYSRTKGHLTEVSVLRYTVNGVAPGTENSLCVYENYGYFGDNNGNIICINLNTMRPVWHYNNHDDTDASIVCQEENGTPYIYTGCEVDKQGDNGGSTHFVKINGLNGEKVWEKVIPCGRFHHGSSVSDGGLYCTPLLGSGDCKGLIFASFSRNGADGKGIASGQFYALDTATGEERYMFQLDRYAWASPVAFLNERDEMFILQCDCGGKMYVIRGATGEVLAKEQVGMNFESSPVAVGNSVVIGSRGNTIYKVTIK